MCGIVGSVNFPFNTNQINDVMGHRGPDERNLFTKDNVSLYHLRLSILDIAGGRQPMHYMGRYSIIFNGEIYNYKELREKHQLNSETNSDTETLLHLYHRSGVQFLDELDGMFAFAIYDSQEKKIFIARDRAGKKPLHIYKKGNVLAFASELNALRSILPLEVQEEHISNYLRLGSMYRSQTPYKNVTELLGGHCAIIDTNSTELQIKKWWDVAEFYHQESSEDFETVYTKVNQHLNTGVKRRIDSSDLEVGSFLSGGIDSGLVTAIASKHVDKLRTFTVSFGGAYDEAPLARLVAEKYKTEHQEINISFDNLLDDVEKIICNYGEPFFDSSAIPSYYVSEEAKKYITVVLNGDGADELFGGYRRYVPYTHYDFFKTPSLLKKLLGTTQKVLPVPHNKKSKYNYLYRLFDLASKSGIDTYFSSTTDIFEGFNEHLILPSFSQSHIQKDFDSIIKDKSLTGLKKIMNLDFNTILFSDLLVKMDIATMAHSLEGRSPFLSKELLEYAPTIQDEFKIKGKTTKYILRELAKEYLPTTLVTQPKRGFEIPLKQWVENDLRDIIYDYLGTHCYSKNFVDYAFISKLLDGKAKVSREKRAKMLWTLFALEVWYKKAYKDA